MSKSRLEYKPSVFDISEKEIQQYIRKKGILQVKFDTENNTVLALEPIQHGERQFWVDQWLKNELSNKKLLEKLHERFQWVEYLDLRTFLESVESCLKQN